MSVRDFSQEKYDALIEALEDIQSKQNDKFTEIGEDYLFKAAHHLGIYDPDNVVEQKMENYQKHMMDAYNTTKTDLTDIFESVEGIDETYGGYFDDITYIFSKVKQSIQLLTDSIQNINDTAALQTLQTKLSELNKQLDHANAKVTLNFDREIDYEMTYLKHKSIKGTIESSLSVLGDVFGFCGSVLKGDAAGTIDKLWSTCNDFMDLCSNSDVLLNVELTAFGSWMLMSFNQGDDVIRNFQRNQLQNAKDELDKEDGVSGQFQSLSDNPENNVFYQLTKGFDTVQDIYGLVDGIKSFGKDIIEGKQFWTKIDDTINPDIPSVLEDNEELSERYKVIKRSNNAFKIIKGGASSALDEEDTSWTGFIQGQLENYTHTGAGTKVFTDVVDTLEEIGDFFDGGFGD